MSGFELPCSTCDMDLAHISSTEILIHNAGQCICPKHKIRMVYLAKLKRMECPASCFHYVIVNGMSVVVSSEIFEQTLQHLL